MTEIEGLPFRSLGSLLLTTATLSAGWVVTRQYVARRGHSAWAQSALELHQFVASTLSLILALYVADLGHGIIQARTQVQVDSAFLGYLYHLLKIYEYLDLILLTLSGQIELSRYTTFSHIFLPYWSYYRVIARPDKAVDWRFQVIGDCVSRFLSRAVPWLIADTRTEQTLLDLVEEGRHYPDLAINAFWLMFVLQGQRGSKQGVESFGQPYENEQSARILATVILVYSSYALKREQAQRQVEVTTRNVPALTSTQEGTSPGRPTR